MEKLIALIPHEILSEVLGHTTIHDIINFQLTSRDVGKLSTNNYLIKILKDKYLVHGDYSKYNNLELLTFVKHSLLYPLEFHNYIIDNPNNTLLRDFYNSIEYKKLVINKYIIPLVDNKEYNIVHKNVDELPWLMYLDIKDIINLSVILYPDAKYSKLIFTVIHHVPEIFNIMFRSKRTNIDIITMLNACLESDGKFELMYKKNIVHHTMCLSVKYNRLDLLQYMVHVYNEVDIKIKEAEHPIDYYLELDDGTLIGRTEATPIITSYISNGGYITDRLSKYLENSDNLFYIFRRCVNDGEGHLPTIFHRLKDYVMMHYLHAYNGIIDKSIFNHRIYENKDEYMTFITYIMGPNANGDIITEYMRDPIVDIVSVVLLSCKEDIIRNVVVKLGINIFYLLNGFPCELNDLSSRLKILNRYINIPEYGINFENIHKCECDVLLLNLYYKNKKIMQKLLDRVKFIC